MDGLKDHLDLLALQIFEMMEALYRKQDMLEQNMKCGFLGISRSRYISGMKSISAAHLQNGDLTANKAIIIDEQLVARGFSIQEDKNKRFIYLMGHHENEPTEMKAITRGDKKEWSEGATVTDVRRRNTAVDREQLTESQKIRAPEENEREAKSSFQKDIRNKKTKSNPLNLFGVLVPQSLHMSQKYFVEALKIATDLVDLKCKLRLLQNEFKRYHEMKVNIAA